MESVEDEEVEEAGDIDADDGVGDIAETEDADIDEDEDAGEVFREWMENAEANQVFEAIDDSALGQAGPGPSTQRIRLNTMLGGRARYLDDDDSIADRVSVPDTTAGVVIRMSQTVHEQWAALFGTRVPQSDVVMDGTGAPDLSDGQWYKPFASELDWRVAQWMVEEGIGHNAFNALLNIPGVCTYND